jgi:hypothetical protein
VVQVVVGEVVCGGEDAGVGGCCYGHFGRFLGMSLWLVLVLQQRRELLVDWTTWEAITN